MQALNCIFSPSTIPNYAKTTPHSWIHCRYLRKVTETLNLPDPKLPGVDPGTTLDAKMMLTKSKFQRCK